MIMLDSAQDSNSPPLGALQYNIAFFCVPHSNSTYLEESRQ